MPGTKREQLEQIVQQMQAAASVIDARVAKGGQPTPQELANMKTMANQARGLKNEIVDVGGRSALQESQAFLHNLGIMNGGSGLGGGLVGEGGGMSGKSIGTEFVESAQFKGFAARFPDGRIPEREAFTVPAVSVKTLITGAALTSGGAFVTPDATGLYDPGTFRRPLTIRDIVTTGRTDSDTVEYLRQTAQTNAAAPVAEATESGAIDGTTITTVEGGLKPESGLTFERVTAAVKTLAHWIPVTRRAMADAGQLRTLIDQFLRYGLEEELEDQMVSGNGVGENFQGITTLSGVQVHAKGTDPLLTAYRAAKTKVGLLGRAEPNAYLMHPNDWQRADLLQDTEGGYYFGGPVSPGSPRLWGLPVVQSEAVTEGTAWVGDFRTLILWDREAATVTASTEHADFFTRNLVAILAEMRAAFGALRPAALVKITGVNA